VKQTVQLRQSPNANPNIQRTGEGGGGPGLERASMRQNVQFGGTRVVPTQLQQGGSGGGGQSGGGSGEKPAQLVRVSRVQPTPDGSARQGGFQANSLRVATNAGGGGGGGSNPTSPNPGTQSSGVSPSNPFQNRSVPQSPTTLTPQQLSLSHSAPSSSHGAHNNHSSANANAIANASPRAAGQEDEESAMHVTDADEMGALDRQKGTMWFIVSFCFILVVFVLYCTLCLLVVCFLFSCICLVTATNP
jgi:hypothetical protein